MERSEDKSLFAEQLCTNISDTILYSSSLREMAVLAMSEFLESRNMSFNNIVRIEGGEQVLALMIKVCIFDHFLRGLSDTTNIHAENLRGIYDNYQEIRL